MNNGRGNKKSTYLLIGIPSLAIAFFVGLYVGTSNSVASNVNPQATNGSFVTSDQFAPFWKAWETLNEKSLYATTTTPDSKVWGAIEGLASSYGDPYTVFFPPAQSKTFQEDITGNFGGVGMEIGMKGSQLVVVAPIKDSPAAKAGVKTGDAIMAIDGTSTASMSTDVAVALIRGTIGTKVTISFLSASSTKPVNKVITRAVINIPTLDTSSQPGGIFVIRLYSFTANSADLFRDALRQFVLSGDHKLILDLRGNPGGYLDAAWDMASYFLPAGKVIVTEDFGSNAPQQIYRSKGYDAFNSSLEMLILVDGGSASASEILSGALQEQGVAKLVGTKTFGKGSVQELIPITDGTSLKVTVARWLTPNGHNLSHDGLDPDYAVSFTDADIASGTDTQMAKAVQLLTAKP